MARRVIPNYSPASRGSLILETDSSFDVDRYERELAALAAAGQTEAEHPVNSDEVGETRYDLDAPLPLLGDTVRPRDYFRQDMAPEVFVLRRLTWEEHNDVERIMDERTKSLKACRYGLVEVEGTPVKLRSVNGQLTGESMQALHDLDPGLPVRIGVAVRLFNQPPTDAEKKR